LEASSNVDLALLNPNTNSVDLLLKITQSIHNLGKNSIKN